MKNPGQGFLNAHEPLSLNQVPVADKALQETMKMLNESALSAKVSKAPVAAISRISS